MKLISNYFSRIVVFTAAIIFIIGCSSHEVQRASTMSSTPKVDSERIQSQGFEMVAKPILSQEEHQVYFDNDLIKQGILPVQVYVKNMETEDVFTLRPENVHVTDSSGNRKPVMTVDQIVEKTKKSYWRTAGWTVLFGVFGAIPSAINVSKTNEKIRNAYNESILKENTLRHGDEAEGLSFFAISEDSSNINGWELSMVLKSNTGSKTVPLKYQLEGKIPERKSDESASGQQTAGQQSAS